MIFLSVVEFLLNVVIFPEQARNLCHFCEKYFTIPLYQPSQKVQKFQELFFQKGIDFSLIMWYNPIRK